MVRHIVMWNLNEGLDAGEVLAKMQQIFGAFSAQVPGMTSLTVHRGFAGYDLCLLSEHENHASLEAYQTFPAHLEAKKYVHSVIRERASCDFEM